MVRFAGFVGFVVVALALVLGPVAPAPADGIVVPAVDTPWPGRIFVGHDEWALTDWGFQKTPNDSRRLALNVAAWFTGGRPGRFLVYSTNAGVRENTLASTMRGAGHTWTITKSAPFTLQTLLQYDGVFLAGDEADNSVLIDYVRAGGNVFVLAGTGLGGVWEASHWNPLPERVRAEPGAELRRGAGGRHLADRVQFAAVRRRHRALRDERQPHHEARGVRSQPADPRLVRSAARPRDLRDLPGPRHPGLDPDLPDPGQRQAARHPHGLHRRQRRSGRAHDRPRLGRSSSAPARGRRTTTTAPRRGPGCRCWDSSPCSIAVQIVPTSTSTSSWASMAAPSSRESSGPWGGRCGTTRPSPSR